ncbi:1382_t:CDS:2, partial [Paraglomus occultum]
ATKMWINPNKTIKQKEIKAFIDKQDLKFAEKRYETNVEISIVTDKTTAMAQRSKKFAPAINGAKNNVNHAQDKRGDEGGM